MAVVSAVRRGPVTRAEVVYRAMYETRRAGVLLEVLAYRGQATQRMNDRPPAVNVAWVAKRQNLAPKYFEDVS